MKLHIFILGYGLLLAATTLCGYVRGQQQAYAVMAPNTIRPNIDYLAAVTVQNIDGELQVRTPSFFAINPLLFARNIQITYYEMDRFTLYIQDII